MNQPKFDITDFFKPVTDEEAIHIMVSQGIRSLQSTVKGVAGCRRYMEYRKRPEMAFWAVEPGFHVGMLSEEEWINKENFSWLQSSSVTRNEPLRKSLCFFLPQFVSMGQKSRHQQTDELESIRFHYEMPKEYFTGPSRLGSLNLLAGLLTALRNRDPALWEHHTPFGGTMRTDSMIERRPLSIEMGEQSMLFTNWCFDSYICSEIGFCAVGVDIIKA